MAILTVSSKGQIVLPPGVRRRLGMGAGAKIEILEEADGLRLRVISAVNSADLIGLAGNSKARTRGVVRRLEDFDPASVLRRPRKP